MNEITCPLLKNSTANQNGSQIGSTIIRIMVHSTIKPYEAGKCVYFINVVNSVANVLNSLKIPFVIHTNDVIGRNTFNGWTGVIGELVNNRSDIGISKFAATLERFTMFKISPPLMYSSIISILSGQIHQNNNRNDFEIFTAFTIDLWSVIIFLIILLSIIDYKIHSKLCEFNFKEIVLKIINFLKLLLTQSSDYYSRICCIKHLLFLGISIFIISLLPIFFTSDILSNLLQDPIYIIDSIDDLVDVIEKTNVKLFAKKEYLAWHILKHSIDYRFQTVFRKLIDTKEHPWQDVYLGKAILVDFSMLLEPVIMANPYYGFHIGRDQYYGTSIGILYQKNINETIKQNIDSVISILFESGLQNLWNALQWNSVKFTPIEEIDEQITIASLRGIFIIYLILILAQLLLFIFELFYFCSKHNKSIQID